MPSRAPLGSAADRVVASTYRLTKNTPPEMVRHVMETRRHMLEARKFTLDAAATEYVVRQSRLLPGQCLKVLPYARPPFPTTWVEWDLATKMRVGGELGLENEGPNRADEGEGVLIRSLSETRYQVSQLFIGMYENTWTSDPGPVDVLNPGFDFVIDTEHVVGDEVWNVDAKSLMRQMHQYAVNHPKMVEATASGLLEAPDLDAWVWTLNSQAWGWWDASQEAMEVMAPDMAALGMATRWVPHTFTMMFKGKTLHDRDGRPSRPACANGVWDTELLKTALGVIRTVRGIARLTATALAVMALVETHELRRVAGERRLVGGRSVPYMSESVVTIKVPVKSIVAVCQRKATNMKKRRHEVRGHWRVIADRKTGERHSTWVNHHLRGDASIGFVRHGYSVEKRDG
jgi:hypothetical protein